MIYQEVSRVDSTSNPAGIITNKRSLESSVTIDDGEIVVLGGLISDTLTDNTDKVPLAGDLPLIGALFRYDTRQRVNLDIRADDAPPPVASGQSSIDWCASVRNFRIMSWWRQGPVWTSRIPHISCAKSTK